ncbi:MAG: hypothetical protein CL823_03255 [Crocinitomicaceae bacterium]|nr:hypothetical protein [Crocinitomicaceae bacterium]
MKSTKDQFEQHVQGLYDGLEVPTPESTKVAVFNALDKQDVVSWSTSTKTVLVTALIILGAAWYMMPEEVASPEAQPTPTPVIEEVLYEEVPRTEVSVEYTGTEDVRVQNSIEGTQVLVEELFEEVVTTSVLEVVEETKVIETTSVIEAVDVEPAAEESVFEEVQSVVHPAVEEKAKEIEPVKDEETEEWVLPATIKVEK